MSARVYNGYYSPYIYNAVFLNCYIQPLSDSLYCHISDIFCFHQLLLFSYFSAPCVFLYYTTKAFFVHSHDNYLFTLMGIAHGLNREGIISFDVHLEVGLSLTWVNRQREDFRKYMLQRESVDFKYENKLYSVCIVGCSVFPQDYAAIVIYVL